MKALRSGTERASRAVQGKTAKADLHERNLPGSVIQPAGAGRAFGPAGLPPPPGPSINNVDAEFCAMAAMIVFELKI